jgi:hypothetical protein
MSDDLIITPDGVLSTITSSAGAGNFGVNWPVLNNDGAALTNTYTTHIASVDYPAGGDQQNFISLHPSPTLVGTTFPTIRSSYGDLRPVRVMSGASDVQTFIYPRSPWDPSAESVRTSFTRSAGNFSTVLGRVTGSIYIGRTSAGGVGTAVDLNNDGTNDVTFGTSTGFILQLANGRVTAAEADRAVTAVIQGQTVTLAPFTPVTLVPAAPVASEAESGTLGGGAQGQACTTCSGGTRVGFLGNGGTSNGTMTFTNVNVPSAGNYVLTLFYSNQDVPNRMATLTVNGVVGAPIAFASTGKWETMAPLNVTVSLNAGNNTVAIGNSTAKAPSFDRMILNVP